MVWFIYGVLALIFGIFYNIIKKNRNNATYKIRQIAWNPRDVMPDAYTYRYLKNRDVYEKDLKEWNEYNEKRKKYAKLIEEEKKKYGIRNEWTRPELLPHIEDRSKPLVLDERLKNIYAKMTADGVSLKYRPEIDFLSSTDTCFCKVPHNCWLWLSNEENPYQGKDGITPLTDPLFLTPKMLEYVHMDYKKYYKEEYLDHSLRYAKN